MALTEEHHNHSILQSSLQQLQQHPYTDDNCTCATTLVNNNTTSGPITSTTNASISNIAPNGHSSSGHIMKTMLFKRLFSHTDATSAKNTNTTTTTTTTTNTTNNNSIKQTKNTTTVVRSSQDYNSNNKNISVTTLSAATQVSFRKETLAFAMPSSSSPFLAATAAASIVGSILAKTANYTLPTSAETSTSSSSSSSSSPASAASTPIPNPLSSSSFMPTSSSSSSMLYVEMKKCCRRFLFVISLICLLHSCLLWNTAAAAISNRATNSRTMSNAPQSPTGIQPRFLSRGHTYRAVVGDTLVLPCQVENLGNFVLLWRRGINVLTASNIMVTRDERVRLIDGYNLEISDLEPQDAGDYVCQISDKINRDQVHTVEILVPPSVRATPTSGNLQARKGGPVTMECKGSGNPVPSIFWTKKSGAGKSTARIGDGPILTLEKVERQQAGVYQCTADNGVGDSVSVDIRLDVLYPPDIQVEKSWIHSGEGFEAKLVCIVYADPIGTVSWYQNSFLIQTTDRRIMSSRGNRHTLTIRHIQQEDFGNYSCVADNTLGRSRKYMELSGRPGPAEFYSPKWGRSSDSYNLTWKIDSYPPLEEVRLLYRRVLMNDTFQQPGRWHDFILTPEHRPASEPLTHIMSYTIKNLVPGAYYEAIVQAKNRYGWNEVSDIFQFIVASNSMDIPPEESEVVASSKSRSNDAAASSRHIATSMQHIQMLATAFIVVSCLYERRRQFSLG